MAKPGRKYKSVLQSGECMRQSFACAAGIPRSRITWITPHQDGPDFWRAWHQEARRHGFELHFFVPDGTNEPNGFWIGGVNSFRGLPHALVMRGKKLYLDPAGERSQRPHKFIDGFKVIPLAD